jgi:hypothetical protein
MITPEQLPQWIETPNGTGIQCPKCKAPTGGLVQKWLQPCGHAVTEEWRVAAIAVARLHGTVYGVTA